MDKMQWISVKERMPEEYETVWIANFIDSQDLPIKIGFGIATREHQYPYTLLFKDSDQDWHIMDGSFEVTHWCPVAIDALKFFKRPLSKTMENVNNARI